MDREITVHTLVEEMRENEKRLPFEIGAFVALEACENLLQLPTAVTSKDVSIRDDGSICIAAAKEIESVDAASALREVLARLLVASGSEVPPRLMSVVEKEESWDLERLRNELEASLVPLNRAAARRVLSRFIRDLRRTSNSTRPPLRESPVASVVEGLDADLDALLSGHDGTRSSAPAGKPMEVTIDLNKSTAHKREVPLSMELPRDEGLPFAGGRIGELQPIDDHANERKPFRLYFIVLLIGLLFIGGYLFRERLFSIQDEEYEAEGIVAQEQEPHQGMAEMGLVGDLHVQVSSTNAQIFLYIDRGPAIASDLPLGIAHEFLAIADGREPTRAVVSADARWTPLQENGVLQYELAMQTGDQDMAFHNLVLGQTRLDRASMGRATGERGQVRVVTTPPGARVFVLIGFGSADVTNIRRDVPHELLVYEEGKTAQRVFVGPSDWRQTPQGSVAEIQVTFSD